MLRHEENQPDRSYKRCVTLYCFGREQSPTTAVPPFNYHQADDLNSTNNHVKTVKACSRKRRWWSLRRREWWRWWWRIFWWRQRGILLHDEDNPSVSVTCSQSCSVGKSSKLGARWLVVRKAVLCLGSSFLNVCNVLWYRLCTCAWLNKMVRT